MELIDLSLPLTSATDIRNTTTRIETRKVPLTFHDGTEVSGIIHDFHFGSMAGTYIDFPGHIAETADGLDAGTCDPARFYRKPAAVVRLQRKSGSGAVTANDLQAALDPGIGPFEILVVNALGELRFDAIKHRSVFFSLDAVKWMVDQQIHLLISDIYESTRLEGVFLKLFAAHISTVCNPVNLYRLPTDRKIRISVMFPAVAEATQLPCRAVAEIEENGDTLG